MRRPVTLLCLLSVSVLGCQCDRKQAPVAREEPATVREKRSGEYLSWVEDKDRPELTATMRHIIASRFWTTPQSEGSIEDLMNEIHGLPAGSVLVLVPTGQAAFFKGRDAELYRTPNVWRMELPPGFGTPGAPKFDMSRRIDWDLLDHPNLSKAQILRTLLMALDSLCVDSPAADGRQPDHYKFDPNQTAVARPRTDTDARLEEFAPSLARLPNRTTLTLTGTKVTDAGLKALAPVHHLTDLELDGTAVTAQGLKELAPLDKLVRLRWIQGDLQRSRVTDEVLLALHEIQLLHTLEVVVTNADAPRKHADGSVTWVSAVRRPTRLDDANCVELYQSKVTDRGLRALKTLPNLSRLDLRGTAVTDAGLKDVGALPNLVWLDVSGTGVTDAGLKELARASNLVYLNLLNTRVTEAGVKGLKQSLPRCWITHR